MSEPLYGRSLNYQTEPYFSRHMEAMTAENLTRKSAIATELAYRDRQIATLRAELAARDKEISRLTVELAECQLYKLLPSVDEPGTITVCNTYTSPDVEGYDPRTDDMGNQRQRYGRGI